MKTINMWLCGLDLFKVRAEAIIAAELRKQGREEASLSRGAKVDACKLALAARLRRETTITMQEIAERLHMGSRNSVGPKLHAWRRANE
jgi:lambda repressor-like predicted transcriptional regulator